MPSVTPPSTRSSRRTDPFISTGERDRFERAHCFFSLPLNSVPIRGLTRTAALRRGLRLRELGTGGYIAGALYVFELALLGRSRRVKRTSYHSRYRPGSVSKGWKRWGEERKRAAWRCLLCGFHAVIMRQDFSEQQRSDASERAAVAHPDRRAALARAWRDDPEGNPPIP